MKRYFIVILLALAVAGCKDEKRPAGVPENGINPDVMKNPASAAGNTSDELPAFEFSEESHDFGEIVQGEKVSYSFKFKNSGKADLVISSASGSCGCTVPEYPRDPIPPGGSGVIKVTFDSAGKQGHQDKKVTLVANTIPNSKVLTVLATVDIAEEK
jgi:hypothetical protein